MSSLNQGGSSSVFPDSSFPMPDRTDIGAYARSAAYYTHVPAYHLSSVGSFSIRPDQAMSLGPAMGPESMFIDQRSMSSAYQMAFTPIAVAGALSMGSMGFQPVMVPMAQSSSTGSVRAQPVTIPVESVPPTDSSQSKLVQVTTYTCGYCGRYAFFSSALFAHFSDSCKVSATSQNGRVRIRCNCGGMHRDGTSRLHGMWTATTTKEVFLYPSTTYTHAGDVCQVADPHARGPRVPMSYGYAAGLKRGPNGSSVRQQLARKAKQAEEAKEAEKAEKAEEAEEVEQLDDLEEQNSDLAEHKRPEAFEHNRDI